MISVLIALLRHIMRETGIRVSSRGTSQEHKTKHILRGNVCLASRNKNEQDYKIMEKKKKPFGEKQVWPGFLS